MVKATRKRVRKTKKSKKRQGSVFYRCRETTLKKKICLRKVREYGGYCWQHPRELYRNRKRFRGKAKKVVKQKKSLLLPISKKFVPPKAASQKKALSFGARFFKMGRGQLQEIPEEHVLKPRSTPKTKAKSKDNAKVPKSKRKENPRPKSKKAKTSSPKKSRRNSAQEFFQRLDRDDTGSISQSEFNHAWKRNLISVYWSCGVQWIIVL